MKAVDDSGHDGNYALKMNLLRAVGEMVRQLARLLWLHQQETGIEYVLCCTGDHSTPAAFGDHSHEPVPFTVAHLSSVVQALGGEEALGGVSLEAVQMPPADAPATAAAAGGRRAPGPPVAGDAVCAFDEVAAAEGARGRFGGAGGGPLRASCGLRP